MFAQNVTVSGNVTAYMDYAPIAGASVLVKNSDVKGVTNVNGSFILANVPLGSTIIINRAGYERAQVVLVDTMMVRDTIALNIVLNEKDNLLNEVVVIGYGTVTKKDLTGSISTVPVEDMQKAPVKSFDDALGGRVAGVVVTSIDGQPGGSPNIVIRGNNSVTQDNSPLYVIDGFPIENPDNNVINPEEIESISILKDASATAIYGARGANGVIVITTKKGKSGPPVITYDTYYGQNTNIKHMDMMNPYQFVQYQLAVYPTEAYRIYTPGDPAFAGNPGYIAGGRTLDYYKNVQGIDWQKLVYRNGNQQNHDFSMRGGTDKTQYSLSGSIFNQEGTIINTGFQRYQGRFTLDQKVTTKLKASFNVNYTQTKTTGIQPTNYGTGSSNSRSLLYSVLGYRPVAGVADTVNLLYDPLDPSVSTDYRFNPVLNAENTFLQSVSNTLVANGHLDYSILDNLVLRVSGGATSVARTSSSFYNSQTNTGDTSSTQGTLGPNGSIQNSQVVTLLNENTLTYTKVFNKVHSLNILGGFTAQSTDVSSYGYQNIHVPNESLGIAGLSQGIPYSTYSAASNNFLESYVGRVNYNYDSRYLFTASFRADGSSKFAPDHKWGYFPSGAAAWNVKRENFMKSFHSVDEAKLRASYGVTGNNRVTDFAYLGTVTEPYNNYYSYGNTYAIGAIPTTLQNNNLKWETTAQFDGGIDLAFLNSKLLFTADYYYKKTTNLLIDAQLPPSAGIDSAYENVGSVSNQGFEFTLTSINVKKRDFRWTTNFNISFNKNKVLALANGQESILTAVNWNTGANTLYPYIAQVGQPIGMFFGYIYDGVYQYSDFNKLPNGTYVLKGNIPTNGSTRASIQPGDAKFKDINGDGVVNAADRTIIGNPNPVFTGGFTNNFYYKGFDLSIFFQFSYGNQILNANKMVFEGSKLTQINQLESETNAWSPTNQNSNIPRYGGMPAYAYSSYYIEDGSYLRLKTISLGYTIPHKLLHKVRINTLRFYVSAQNLITLTKYSGYDPEVSTANTALTPGFDYSAYPKAKTFVGGLNLSF